MKLEEFNSDPLGFASLVAHQLQSPLSSVSQSLQSVLSEYLGTLQPRQRDTLEKANLRCNQAMTSVRRMLAIISAQKGEGAQSSPSSPAGVLRDLHSQYVEEAARHDVTLSFDDESEGAYVALGEGALSEVLVALLNNAMKYTPEHGRIRVSVGPGEEPDRLRLSVEDSGIGIPDKDRERVFEPFFRASSARDSKRPGVGLGLAFVKSVVTAAGGSVAVGRSELGGAEFVVDLPTVEAPKAGEGTVKDKAPSFRVVIVGGVAAGPKAAAKINRLMPDADVTIVEKGNVMSYAGCGLPYYVGGDVRSQKGLISSPAGVVRDPVFFHQVKNVTVQNQTEVLEIDRSGKRVRTREGSTQRESWLPYDRLVLATGASAIVPGGLKTDLKNVFTLHGVRDAEGIRTALAESKATDVVIVGGGLLGIEMTEALVKRGARVTIVEKLPHILPMLDNDMARLVERHLEANGVRVVTNTAAQGFEGAEGVLTRVLTDHGPLQANLAIVAIGVQPNVELAADAGLELGETGAVLVDEHMQTSDPDIYAAGDCAECRHLITGRPCYIPLGSTANKQGRVAAVNICGGSDTFPGVLGTRICKVFDYTVAVTGLGEAEARDLGYEVVSALVPGPDRAPFMPAAKMLFLKIVADRQDGRLLGVQATGPGTADKRIDVAALAIASQRTVDQLANDDLSYAPPYSTAMDNIITACNVVRNKMAGYMHGVAPAEVHRMLAAGEDLLFLDVRTPGEYDRVRLPKSTLIPLGSLRGRLSEIPHDREIVVFCDISLRGYEAELILRAAGFQRVRVMDGGVAMWPYEKIE